MIMDPRLDLQPFEEFETEPSFCPIDYGFELSPATSEQGGQAIMAVDFYPDERIFSFFSEDLLIEGDYTATVRAFGPINVPTNVSFDFEIVFINPCKVATFTIDPSILSANPIEYELGTETLIE